MYASASSAAASTCTSQSCSSAWNAFVESKRPITTRLPFASSHSTTTLSPWGAERRSMARSIRERAGPAAAGYRKCLRGNALRGARAAGPAAVPTHPEPKLAATSRGATPILYPDPMKQFPSLLRAGVAGVALFTVSGLAFAGAQPSAAFALQAPAAPQSEHLLDLMVGDVAPPIAVKKFVKGEEIRSFQKGQVYVVEYWATWCGPCRATIPHLTELQAKLGSKVKFIGVSVWEKDQSLVEPFVTEMGDKMVYSIAMDDVPEGDRKGSNGKMAKAWMTAAARNGIPSAFIVDGDGKIAWIGHPMSGMEKTLDAILAGEFDLAKATKEYAGSKEVRAAASQQALNKALESGDNAAALAALDKMVAQDPKNPNAAMTKFSVMLNRMKSYDAAYAYGAELVDGLFKDNSNLLNAMAWTIVDPDRAPAKQDLPLALRAATRANELVKDDAPMKASVLDTLARVYFAMGEVAKAIETQTKAVALAPEQQKAELQKTLDLYKTPSVKG
ncbi:MAG: redoxin domain-containing protein [Planctomycetota bacterium]|nr:MAG: redoxin domain-containing protein [Planctomycetota bacterium]